MNNKFFTLITTLLMALAVNAQDKAEVFSALQKNDSILFEITFNKCQLSPLEELISEDFEFYHDKSGIIDSKDKFITNLKNGICNPDNEFEIKRTLVPNSLEVFPLYDNGKLYAAIQKGIHSFSETHQGKTAQGSVAKFTHLWIKVGERWELKRVLSYDHVLQKPEITSVSINPEDLIKFKGEYLGEMSGIATVTVEDDHLILETGKKQFKLIPTGQYSFAIEGRPVSFIFEHTNDKITTLLVSENGEIAEKLMKKTSK